MYVRNRLCRFTIRRNIIPKELIHLDEIVSNRTIVFIRDCLCRFSNLDNIIPKE